MKYKKQVLRIYSDLKQIYREQIKENKWSQCTAFTWKWRTHAATYESIYFVYSSMIAIINSETVNDEHYSEICQLYVTD